ncbi:MAG: hypothetical protein LBN39_07660 [Planctomycetaceae bacterium]|jgi:hypothetical protein|nr:hypothetical protein [Planctomycetaceae bacterium]
MHKPVFIALVVLLVHLSAAGGISVPSTAVLIWLFLAVLLNQKELSADAVCRPHTKIQKTFCLFILFLAILFVYYFGLRPVSQFRQLTAKMQDPVYQNNEAMYSFVLRQAVNADPWSAILREQWIMEDANTANTLVLLPRSAGLRYRFAERYAIMYERTGTDRFRLRAAELYRQAIERYPNNATYRAALALFLRKTGKTDAERSEAAEQGKEALRLDGLMPHTEQKLPKEILEKCGISAFP